MHERGRRSGKLHENQLVLVKLVMGRNPSLRTLMYEVVHLLGIGPDRRQNDRCTTTFRVDMEAGDQTDLHLRDMAATTGNLHQMFHHTQHTHLEDRQIHTLTLMRSGPHRQDGTVSPDITLQNRATTTLFLPVRGDDLKLARLHQHHVDTPLRTIVHLLLAIRHKPSVLTALR